MKYTTTISYWAELGWINPEALHDNPDLAAEFGHVLVNDSLMREGQLGYEITPSIKEIWIRGLGIVKRENFASFINIFNVSSQRPKVIPHFFKLRHDASLKTA